MSYSHADFKHCVTIASTSRFWWRIVTDFFLALANQHLTYITRLCALRAIVPCPPSLRTLCALIFCLRVRLHGTETKSHPGMKRNLIQSLFFKKVAGWPANFIKKETLAQVFSSEFSEISQNTPSYEHLRWLLLAFPDMVLRKRTKQKLQYQLNYHKMWLK